MARKRPNFHTGKLEKANHSTSGQFEVGDPVRLFGGNEVGVIEQIKRSNFGKGRPEALVNWGDSKRFEPLGKLRKL